MHADAGQLDPIAGVLAAGRDGRVVADELVHLGGGSPILINSCSISPVSPGGVMVHLADVPGWCWSRMAWLWAKSLRR